MAATICNWKLTVMTHWMVFWRRASGVWLGGLVVSALGMRREFSAPKWLW